MKGSRLIVPGDEFWKFGQSLWCDGLLPQAERARLFKEWRYRGVTTKILRSSDKLSEMEDSMVASSS